MYGFQTAIQRGLDILKMGPIPTDQLGPARAFFYIIVIYTFLNLHLWTFIETINNNIVKFLFPARIGQTFG